MSGSNFMTEQEFEREKLKRRRAVADAMLADSMQPLGDTQMVSGIAVRRSPLEGIAKMAKAYIGGLERESADTDEKTQRQQGIEAVARAMSGFERATTPRAAVPGSMQEDASGNAWQSDAQPAYTPSAGDRRGAAMRLAGDLGMGREMAQAQLTEAFRTPKLTHVDLGSHIGYVDEAGNVVQRIPKSASPDAVLREGGSNARHLTPSGSSMLTDERARSEGAAGRAVTLRGQDLTDARGRDLNALQRDQGRIPQGYRYNDTGSLEAIPGGPADMGRALPNAAVKDLGAAGGAVEDTSRLAGSFRPEFGGKTVLGDMSNTFKRVLGDSSGQAQWWQDMDALQNRTRHELFGSALTKTELGAWEKTSITPRMDPGQIQENLNRRQAIEARAASKLARAYEAGGYNKNQIREVLGRSAQYLDQPAPAVSGVNTGTRRREDILKQYGLTP